MKSGPFRPLRLLVPEFPSPEALLPWLKRIHGAGVYTNFGPLSLELENRLAAWWSRDQPVAVTAVSTGTAALTLALAALGLPPDARVLVPALTFPGTAAAVVAAGLRPVLGAVDEGSWQLTPRLAERAAAVGVVAAVPVAVFGQPVPVADWDALGDCTGLKVVVDAAGAIGDQRVGRNTGVVVSLHATKPLPAGEGGVFAAANAEWVRRVRQRSNFGFVDGVAAWPAGNAKLSEWHAAAALAGWESWPRRAWRLRRLAARYGRGLGRLDGRVRLPEGHRPWARMTLVVRIRHRVTEDLRAALGHAGIPTRRWYYPPLTAHPAYAGCETFGDTGATAELAEGLLGLPFHGGLEAADVERVVAALDSLLT
ncbi:MAG: aminotransferase class I/II-fold pyridoxal phosphate-dependent enzyme [Verrucomicrobiales bacterium]